MEQNKIVVDSSIAYRINTDGVLVTYPGLRLPMHDSITAWITVDRHKQEIKELRMKQDSLRIEKGDTLFTIGPVGSLQIRLEYNDGKNEHFVKPDSQRVWIAIDRHKQEIQTLKNDLTLTSGVIVVLVLLLAYTANRMRKYRRYFR